MQNMPIVTVDGTLASCIRHGIWCSVAGDGPISMPDWNLLVEYAVEQRPVTNRAIVWTRSSSPSYQQRTQLASITIDSQSADGFPMAVLTDSQSAKTGMSALSWLMGYEMRFFASSAIDTALGWLHVGQSDGEAVRRVIIKMRRQLGLW